MLKYIGLLLIASLFCFKAKAQRDTLIRPDSLVDVKPSFKGGEKAYVKFLVKTVHYPAEDRDKSIIGKVEISFIVETDGRLTNFEIKRAPSRSMGAETLRVMKLSPPWLPGTIQNVPVRVRYTLPMDFSLR
jgi:TonB family protein